MHEWHVSGFGFIRDASLGGWDYHQQHFAIQLRKHDLLRREF